MVIARYDKTDFGPQAQFGLARCLEESGHFSEAMSTYQKVLPRYPNPDVIKLRMERLELRRASLKPTDAGNFQAPGGAADMADGE